MCVCYKYLVYFTTPYSFNRYFTLIFTQKENPSREASAENEKQIMVIFRMHKKLCKFIIRYDEDQDKEKEK